MNTFSARTGTGAGSTLCLLQQTHPRCVPPFSAEIQPKHSLAHSFSGAEDILCVVLALVDLTITYGLLERLGIRKCTSVISAPMFAYPGRVDEVVSGRQLLLGLPEDVAACLHKKR